MLFPPYINMPDHLGVLQDGHPELRAVGLVLAGVLTPKGTAPLGGELRATRGLLLRMSLPEGIALLGGELRTAGPVLAGVLMPEGIALLGGEVRAAVPFLAGMFTPEGITLLGGEVIVSRTAFTSRGGVYAGCRRAAASMPARCKME